MFVRSKCNIFSIIRSCVICFSFAYANQFILLFVHLFSLFFGVNLGAYSFLSVFAPSLAFLCCFIFISAFLSFYSFIFRMFQRIFHIVVLQYSLGSSFWSALSAVLFSFLQVSSRYSQSALQQFSLAETIFNPRCLYAHSQYQARRLQ